MWGHNVHGRWAKIWRRRPELNRGWRFCRPLPYRLATAPLESTEEKETRRADALALSTAGELTGGSHHHKQLITYHAQSRAKRAPRERSGASKRAARERVRGAAGAQPPGSKLERETGFEPATSTLARSHSTTELFPPLPTRNSTQTQPPAATRPARAGRRAPYDCLSSRQRTRSVSRHSQGSRRGERGTFVAVGQAGTSSCAVRFSVLPPF